MSKYRVIAALTLIVTGCSAGTGVVDDLRAKTNQISYGDSKGSVIALLGQPGDRSFRETDEAWQYCEGGMSTFLYSTVYFKNATVYAVTSSTDMPGAFVYNCIEQFPEIDWGQVPADTTIDLNVN